MLLDYIETIKKQILTEDEVSIVREVNDIFISIIVLPCKPQSVAFQVLPQRSEGGCSHPLTNSNHKCNYLSSQCEYHT
jgi:hypothetical protein